MLAKRPVRIIARFLKMATMTLDSASRPDVKKPDSMIWLNSMFKICDVPLIDIKETGGKCKFRTCDPCSVNAVLYP